MDDVMPLITGLGVVALLIAGVGGAMWLENRRIEALRQAAAGLGLTFDPSPTAAFVRPFASLDLFGRGRSGRASHAMLGGDLVVFEYRYTTGSGKSKRHPTQTVAAILRSDLDLPAFSLRPEHLGHAIAGLFGYQDIDLPDHPTFSRSYLLRGKDEARIRARFRPELVRLLEAQRGLCVEANGDVLIVYRDKVRVAPEGIGELVALVRAVDAALGGRAPLPRAGLGAYA